MKVEIGKDINKEMDKYKLLKNIVNSEKINELFELLDES